MPLVKVMKCVIAEKFKRRVRENGEVIIQGVIMDASGDDRAQHVVAGAAGPSTGNVGGCRPVHVNSKFIPLYVNEDIKDDKLRESILSLCPKSRVMMTQVLKYESSCRLTANSKMMTKVSAFPYSEEELEGYVKPPLVSIPEAKGSPRKRRLCVEGDVSQVGDCIVTDTYKRRSLWVSGGGASIEVVLWGEAAEQKLVPASNVKIHALIKEERRLASTSSTSFEIPDLSDARGTMIAIGDVTDGFPVQVILEDGSLLYVGENVAVDLEAMELPVDVQYKASGHGDVYSMEVLVNSDSDL